MKKFILFTLIAFATSAFAQEHPTVTYDGGDLYFVPAKLTSKGIAFMYSLRSDWETGKTWVTIFDDQVQVVKQVEIEPEVLNYQVRTITSQRRSFVKSGVTRAAGDTEEGYFLDDDWTVISDVTENKTEVNREIEGFEVYEDNNNYHSRYMYLSQTLFDNDEDFEFLRTHYEIMPLSYCAADDPTSGLISMERPSIGGEECDEITRDYDYELGGEVFTLKRYKVCGGTKMTGTDIISLDGTVKKSLNAITSFGTVVAINGNYYVTGYDHTTSKYGLYKIASVTSSLAKVADISSETGDNFTYNLSGFRVKDDTKGIVIRNGIKHLNR